MSEPPHLPASDEPPSLPVSMPAQETQPVPPQHSSELPQEPAADALPEPVRTPWSPWQTFYLGVLGMLLMTMSQAAVALSFGVVFAVQYRVAHHRQMPHDALMAAIAGSPLMLPLAVLASVPVMGLALWLVIRWRRGPAFSDYLALRGFRPRQFFLWLLAFAAVLVSGGIFIKSTNDESSREFLTSLLRPGADVPWLIAAVTLGAPLVEETLFRGFMYRGMLAGRLGVSGAIVIPNFLWVLLHVQYSWQTLSVLFSMGLVLGCARHFSGSTLLPVALHFLSNSWSLVVGFAMLQEAANG